MSLKLKKIQTNHVVEIKDDDVKPLGVDEIRKADEVDMDEIPEKELFGYNLKKIKGYREQRAKKKDEKMKKDFIEKVKKMLELISDDETMYDYDILKDIIIMAEHYFIEHKKCGELKRNAVIDATVDLLFDGNKKIAEKMIELKIKEIWQSNIVTKNKTKIGRFFFGCLKNCF